MQSGARTFADGVQAADAALSVQIHLDATAETVSYTHLDVYKRQVYKQYERHLYVIILTNKKRDYC